MNKVLSFSFIILMLISLNTCKKSDDNAIIIFERNGNIDAKGGIVKTPDGASVEIPAGALSSSQAISIENITSAVQNINTGNKVYEMKPDGLTFSDSITIKLPFDNSYLSQSSKENNNDIRIIVLANDTWSILPTKVDFINKTAIIKTKHFSSYAVSYPSDYAKFFNEHKGTGNKILQVPYYNQRQTNWCAFYSTSMISKYAGYNYKAPFFASLLVKPVIKGLNLKSDWESFDSKLNQLGIQTERVYPPWASVNDLCGYLMKKLDGGLPILVGSVTENHAFVVSGYDAIGFYINDPSGSFVNNALGNITGWGDCEMVLVPFDNFKNTLVNVFWDILTVPFGGQPEGTLVITSKGTSEVYGPTLNFEYGNSEFKIISVQNQFIASLSLSGIYQPNGYAFTNANNSIITSLDGSNYMSLDGLVVSNIDQNNRLSARVHYEIDNIDVSVSPFDINVPAGNSNFSLGAKKFQLYNLSKGMHTLKIELRSIDSIRLFDRWTFNFEINSPYIINTPTISTNSISKLSSNSVTSGGDITSDGGAAVTARGVCWGTTSNPTISLTTKTTDGTGTGAFTSSITGLTANTTYHVRAYATNSVGTAYGSDISFTTTDAQTVSLTDADGNTYNTVTIGTQVWMAENLKTTKYNDGSNIPNITDGSTWINLTTSAYCWYNNDASNKANYGALYNWYSVVDGRKICPSGWHVPTDNEWTTLETYLGGISVSGGKLKATALWSSPNTGATNESGFTAFPGGYRGSSGTFVGIGNSGIWWSTTTYLTSSAWIRLLSYNSSNGTRSNNLKERGFSVRCVKD